MEIINEDLSPELKKMNEMFVSVQNSLSPRVTNSVYYNRLKYLMFGEIVKFCKEKIELRNDLLNIRSYIGEFMSEADINRYFTDLKMKYNGSVHNVGLEYHIETTRIDYGVCVFVIIKRDNIYVKKFIYRFRKDPQIGIESGNLSPIGNLLPEKENQVKDDVAKLLGGKEDV